MINFDSLTLKALLNEIEPVLSSGRIQKVQQPSRNEVLLGIRSGGKNHKLHICIDPKYPHIALLSEEGEDLRDISIPQKPPMFCMLLRKHMEGAKIRTIKQPEHERILEIYFDSYNELGARVPLVMACEIMGKYSNIILYNYDNNIILGCAHNVGPEKSRERELSGGLPYVYPVKQNKINLLNLSEDEFLSMTMTVPEAFNVWLNKTFFDISLALATELCKSTGIEVETGRISAVSKENILKIYKLLIETLSLKNLNPSISVDNKLFSLIGIDPAVKWEKVASVNLMTDLYFGDAIFEDNFSRLKSNLNSAVNRELKKQRAKLSQHQKSMEAEEKADKYRQYADILMANLHKVSPGADQISLENFYNNGEPANIPLDSMLSANQNAQRYYKLYNKAKNAAQISESLAGQIKMEIEYLETVMSSLDQAQTLSDLRQIKDELISLDYMKGTIVKQKSEKMAILELNSSNKFKIYVGKNNRQNDYIVSKIASSEDIWMHTQNIPGSHILIKVPHEIQEVPESTLHEAANLAAYFSQGKESSNVPVIYTKRRFLKKPPGSKPGYVTYSHEKTFFVNPDKDLINKLLN